jgi:hypothetical protein
VLFDGEPGLANATARRQVQDTYNIRLYADPLSKRNLAERAVRGRNSVDYDKRGGESAAHGLTLHLYLFSEFKLRLSIILEQQSKKNHA